MYTKRVPIEERFWTKVDKSAGPEGCWLWTGCKIHHGYGMLNTGGKHGQNKLAHRISWELHHSEPIPEGMEVLHRCDNPSCVNPAHLFLGTQKDNVADMISKHRSPYGKCFYKIAACGEANHAHKLTAADVLEIRAACAKGETQRSVALRYGVAQSTIGKIANRERWSHI